MDLSKRCSLELVSRDIKILRNLMYQAREQLGRIDDPLLIQISQFLDLKLNQQNELMYPINESGGMCIMDKKKKLNKIVKNNIKVLSKEEEQLQWQKSIVREEHVKSK